MDCNSNTCSVNAIKKKGEMLSIWSWLFIALLPKCPLCILSYSTAISLCGGKTLFQESVGWTSYIPIILASLVIASFIYNYKGEKTLAAIGIAVGACLIILYGEYYTKSITTYYWGVAALFFACWVNGSFAFFIKKFQKAFQKREAQKI